MNAITQELAAAAADFRRLFVLMPTGKFDWDSIVQPSRRLKAALDAYDAMPQRPGIVLTMEGGIVQDVTADREVDVMILDYDNEGEEEDKQCRVDQGEGQWETALVAFLPVEVTPEYVRGRFDKYRATNGEEC